MKLSFPALFAALLVALAAPGARAQEVERIAAVVNDDLISVHDLERRLNMVIASTHFVDTPDNRRRLRSQVLRNLIDERLQAAESKKLGFAVAPPEIERGLQRIAAQNGVEFVRLDEMLKNAGIEKDALVEQISAELAWSKVMNNRLLPLARVSEEEIDDELAKADAARGQPESLVAEILMPVDQRDKEDDALRTAQRLVEQLRGGASFAAVARQFSAGANASNGGEVGWMLPGQMPPESDEIVQSLGVGQISEPIRTFGGYSILTVLERRRALTADPMTTRVRLSQYVVPVAPRAPVEEEQAALRRAVEVGSALDGCDSLEARAKADNAPASGGLGALVVRDMPADLQRLALELPIGRSSQPLKSDIGYRVLMVCARIEPPQFKPPDREDIRTVLENRRVALLAQRYLRNLRRDAYLEIR
jgi:peptidyl-prolyl cis-trans isomerase SurA